MLFIIVHSSYEIFMDMHDSLLMQKKNNEIDTIVCKVNYRTHWKKNHM